METDVFAEVRRALPRLRPAEARVAQSVLAAPEQAAQATVAELARAADVSEASVVRFARNVGFGGLPELRRGLVQALSRRELELEQSNIAEGTINASDSLSDVVHKIAFHEARSIEETARLLDQDALDRVAREIAAARPVMVFGVGASALAAQDLGHKLARIGLVCQFHADTHVQLVHAALADRRSIAVGVSFSGDTSEVLRALELAGSHGALTVALTSDPDSPVGQAADEVLRTSAREAHERAGALASRMVQLAVVDFLFVRVAQLRFQDLGAALAQTREATQQLRVRPEHH